MLGERVFFDVEKEGKERWSGRMRLENLHALDYSVNVDTNQIPFKYALVRYADDEEMWMDEESLNMYIKIVLGV